MFVKEFAWVKPDGTWERNRICPAQEYKKYYNEKDFHSTWVTYTSAEYWYGEMVGNFVMDFDDEMYPENARMDALVTIENFKQMGLKPEDFYILFSGSKGFHLEIPYEKYLDKPDLHLVDIYRLWGEEIKTKTKFNTLDLHIYEVKRLWRFPNTINSKSGLYCRYITYDELRNLTIGQIRALAKEKGRIPNVSKDKIRGLQDIYQKFRRQAENDWKQFKIYINQLQWTEKDKLPCIQGLLTEGAGLGERNNSAYVLACYYKKIGKNADQAVEILTKGYIHAGEKGFTEKEIRTTVNSAYKSNRDGIGCNNYLMKSHCDRANCPLHNKKEEEIGEVKKRKLNDVELEALIKQRTEAGEYEITLKTGLTRLDEIMPIRRTDLLFVVAPPASGKTTLLFNFIKNIAYTKRCLYFPLEEDEIDTMERKKNLGISSLPNLDYYGLDLTYVTIQDIEIEMASGLYECIFIDQLNKILLGDGKPKSNFREYFTNVVIKLRELTKKYRIPVFVLHQLNRGWENELHPTFSLFKETSAIEEEATRVICFWSYRYNQYRQSKIGREGAETKDIWNYDIYIMKGRGLGVSKIPVVYNMKRGLILEPSEAQLPFDMEVK